jgi:hypothetical protein
MSILAKRGCLRRHLGRQKKTDYRRIYNFGDS